MPPWTFICALPGLDAKECVDAGDVSIVPMADPRFSVEQLGRFGEVKQYLAQFRNVHGRPVPSLMVIRKAGLPLILGDDLIYLRNSFALAVVRRSRAVRAQRRMGAGPMFTDAFDLPAVWIRRTGPGLLIETQDTFGPSDGKTFCGHPAPVYPFGAHDRLKWDEHLLNALIALFTEKRTGEHGAFRRRVERILQIAYLAFRSPGISMSSRTDWGTTLALTVSAFESIANQAGSVNMNAVQALIEAIPWSRELRKKLAPYEYRSPHKRLKNGVFVPLPKMIRPVQVYARLYRARNMVLHGQDYEKNRLEPGRRHKSWGPLQFESAVVFRCLLLHTLSQKGFCEYLRDPTRSEWRRLSMEEALDRHVNAKLAHDLFYDALGCGLGP